MALATTAAEPSAAAHKAIRRLPRCVFAARHPTSADAVPTTSPTGAAKGFQAARAAQQAKTSAASGQRLRLG